VVDAEIEAIDETFNDLVVRMMNMDPRRRLTVREALGHEWSAHVQ
jgi:serine/threonine protein kinase